LTETAESKIKWYAYPLALVAWLLVAIYIFIFTWNALSGDPNPDWAWYLPAVAGVYLIATFILSKINRAWELEVVIQVALVLGPLLWYLNDRPPYKPPVYVFLIEAGFEGDARVYFTNDEATKTQVRSTADTLYFKFDGQGEILLNEDFRTVREAIENRFYFLYPDQSRKKITVIPEGTKVVTDSTAYVAYEDSTSSDKGKINFISWKVSRADRVK
jgi:hypothetical protein